MFTGIIKDKGRITEVFDGDNSRRITIATGLELERIEMGASVACDGCCLTVVAKTADSLSFDVGAETMDLTAVADWAVGRTVNLETALRLGDELGGHMVSGHLDGVAVVEDVRPDGDSWRLLIRAPDRLAHFISSKGSVALNGISLTVNEVNGSVFGICIIPHTWQVTNISEWKKGVRINLEIDQIARYVARIMQKETA